MKKILWTLAGIWVLRLFNDELITLLVLTVGLCVFLGWLLRGAPEGY